MVLVTFIENILNINRKKRVRTRRDAATARAICIRHPREPLESRGLTQEIRHGELLAAGCYIRR